MEEEKKIINWVDKVRPVSKNLAETEFLLIGDKISKKNQMKTFDSLSIIYHDIYTAMTLSSDNTVIVIDYIETRHQYNIDDIDLKRNLREFLSIRPDSLIIMKKPSQIPDYNGLVLNGKKIDQYLDENLLKVGFVDITDRFYFNPDPRAMLCFDYYAYNNKALERFNADGDFRCENINSVRIDTAKSYLTDIIYVANVFTPERFYSPKNRYTRKRMKYVDSNINDLTDIKKNILENIAGHREKVTLSMQSSTEYEYVATFLDNIIHKPYYAPNLRTVVKVANTLGMDIGTMLSDKHYEYYLNEILIEYSKIPAHDVYTKKKVLNEFKKIISEALYPVEGEAE